MRRAVSSLLRLLVALAALRPAIAVAEPYIAVREGAPCSLCHVNRTGGGKRTPYGQVYAQTTLTTFQRGRWPWSRGEAQTEADARGLAIGFLDGFLSVGADLRAANVTNFGRTIRNGFDLREANLYVSATFGDRVALVFDETLGPGGAEPREAYGLLRGPWGTYLRGGLLLLPFGLRVWDDETFTRKVTGFNYAGSDLGVEVGLERRPFYLQVAASNGTIGAADNNNAKQLSGIAQLIWSGFRVGISGTYNVQPESWRAGGGLFLGARLGRITLLAEADALFDHLDMTNADVKSLVALVEASVLVTRGVNLRFAWEYHDPFLDEVEDQKTRMRVALDWFPMTMTGVSLGFTSAAAPPQDQVGNAQVLALELHLFL